MGNPLSLPNPRTYADEHAATRGSLATARTAPLPSGHPEPAAHTRLGVSLRDRFDPEILRVSARPRRLPTCVSTTPGRPSLSYSSYRGPVDDKPILNEPWPDDLDPVDSAVPHPHGHDPAPPGLLRGHQGVDFQIDPPEDAPRPGVHERDSVDIGEAAVEVLDPDDGPSLSLGCRDRWALLPPAFHAVPADRVPSSTERQRFDTEVRSDLVVGGRPPRRTPPHLAFLNQRLYEFWHVLGDGDVMTVGHDHVDAELLRLWPPDQRRGG